MTFANTPPNTPQTNSIITRLATLADIASIAPLFNTYRQFYEQADNLAVATAFIQERLAKAESVIILALDDAQTVIGFCQLYPTFCSVEAAPIYTLYDLFVSPQARRTGAARALLRAAGAYAAQMGRVRMDLTTARTNASAQALYESEGWVQDAVFLTYNKAVLTV
jgi:ribosomal protein S18 acetylase RimI-like enzyme